MPLGQNSVRGGSNNIQSYAITDNPVFKVKIRSLQTNVEEVPQKGREDSDTDYTKKYKVGDFVKGTGMGKDKVYSGEITKIEKNEKGEGTSLIIIDKDSKKRIKLDPSTCSKKELKGHNRDTEDLPFFADSLNHVMSYSEYLNRPE